MPDTICIRLAGVTNLLLIFWQGGNDSYAESIETQEEAYHQEVW